MEKVQRSRLGSIVMRNKVLLVEDEKTLLRIVEEMLSREGYDVTTATNGVDAINLFKSSTPDIVIADVMMPRMDGFEMVRKIRKFNDEVPILFITARSAIDDVVEGFELGANDYLRKPFRMEELLVRIKALLRRNKRMPEVIAIGRYTFRVSTQQLLFENKAQELTYIETVILKTLAVRINEAVESGDLMMVVWQNDDPYNLNRLHGFIFKLRKYLDKDSAISIINIRGIGYKLKVE